METPQPESVNQNSVSTGQGGQGAAPGPGAPPPTGGPSGSPHTAMAVFAYLGVLIVIPFVTEAKNDPFVKFHLKQGLLIIIGWIVMVALGFVPFINFLVPFLWLALAILDIIGLINAAQGKMKELPLIGGLAHSFHF